MTDVAPGAPNGSNPPSAVNGVGRNARRRVGIISLAVLMVLVPTAAVASSWHQGDQDRGTQAKNAQVRSYVINPGTPTKVYVDQRLDRPLRGSVPRAVRPSSCVAKCVTRQQVNVVVLSDSVGIEGIRPALVTGDIVRTGTTRIQVRDLRGQDSRWRLLIRFRGVVDAVSGQPLTSSSLTVKSSCVKTAGPLSVLAYGASSARVGEKSGLCRTTKMASGQLAGGLVDVSIDMRVVGVVPVCDTTVPDGDGDFDCDHYGDKPRQSDCPKTTGNVRSSHQGDRPHHGQPKGSRQRDGHDDDRRAGGRPSSCPPPASAPVAGQSPVDSHVARVLLDYYLVRA